MQQTTFHRCLSYTILFVLFIFPLEAICSAEKSHFPEQNSRSDPAAHSTFSPAPENDSLRFEPIRESSQENVESMIAPMHRNSITLIDFWNYFERYIDSQDRERVDCIELLKRQGLKTFLILGQSNAASFTETKYRPKNEVFTFFKGRCYRTQDPLLGTDGYGGSVWSRMANILIDLDHAQSILLIPIAYGGTPIVRWATGDLSVRLDNALSTSNSNGLKIDLVLWHQGESDVSRGNSAEHYEKMFEKVAHIIRKNDIDAPIYVANATICSEQTDLRVERQNTIRAAQKNLVNTEKKIRQGPDTDLIWGTELRYDNCHFSDLGTSKHAESWIQAIYSSL